MSALAHDASQVVGYSQVLHTQVVGVFEIPSAWVREVAVEVVLREARDVAALVGFAPSVEDVGRTVEVAFYIAHEHVLTCIECLSTAHALEHGANREVLPSEACSECVGPFGSGIAHVLTVLAVDYTIVVEVFELQVACFGIWLDAVAVLGVGFSFCIALEYAEAVDEVE